MLNYREIFDTSAKRREANVLKGCIKICSIIKLNNKVLIKNNALFLILVHTEWREMWFDIRGDVLNGSSLLNPFRKGNIKRAQLLRKTEIYWYCYWLYKCKGKRSILKGVLTQFSNSNAFKNYRFVINFSPWFCWNSGLKFHQQQAENKLKHFLWLCMTKKKGQDDFLLTFLICFFSFFQNV